MEFASGPPSQWHVTLKSGGVMLLAADGFTEADGFAIFSLLAHVSLAERQEVHVLGSSLNGATVNFLVAKIPLADVAKIEGGWSWSTDLGD
ncbi:hypothetical protein [Krasilnikovia sp. M28-CT-15]|uniref:hypothetical protein n=1 Tax=Krasilnikovia sp. M28-CT-15 TaxID=3373540 RepID=UPI00399C87E6